MGNGRAASGPPPASDDYVVFGGDLDELGDLSWLKWRQLSDNKRRQRLFVMFATMVVRDGVPVEEAHRALSEIKEYYQQIPWDMATARNFTFEVPSLPEDSNLTLEQRQLHFLVDFRKNGRS